MLDEEAFRALDNEVRLVIWEDWAGSMEFCNVECHCLHAQRSFRYLGRQEIISANHINGGVAEERGMSDLTWIGGCTISVGIGVVRAVLGSMEKGCPYQGEPHILGS